jgi:hypothetical protein
MTTVEKKQSEELLQGFEQLMVKYVELNRTFLEESPKMFARLAANPANADVCYEVGKEALRKSVNDWLELSHRHIDDLISLSKTSAERFYAVFENSTAQAVKEKASGPPREQQPERPSENAPEYPTAETLVRRVGLNLKGRPGEIIISNFTLKSANDKQRKGRFESTPFQTVDGAESPPSFQPVFIPDDFVIMPGVDLPVKIETELPLEMPPGTYRAHVMVHGFEQASFYVVLSVEKPSSTPRNRSKGSAIKKK